MRHVLPSLRSPLLAGVLLAATVAWGEAPGREEAAIAQLQAAYAEAVGPGVQGDLYGTLLASVLRRVYHSHVTSVDLDALAAVAGRTIAAEPRGTLEARALFLKAINTALGTLDPYSRFLDGSAPANDVPLASDPVVRREPLTWKMEGDVLVLRLPVFTAASAAALRQAVAEASSRQAPAAVVLDLRGNPGGPLPEAVAVADAFLAEGEIVTLKGRTPQAQHTWHADPEELLPGVAMAVLLDAHSASASELVAAALQDHHRAVVLGQRSFGKGSVQGTFSLGRDVRGALRLTSWFYYRPAGTAVQQAGVTPDVEIAATQATDAQATAAPQAPVDPMRCAAVYPSRDAGLACAVAYLHAGGVERFLAQLAR
ncbi:hypothetical protein H8N03_22795 [Ramlibacter sp. USB13]|uniref:Tail specific protease domain-containing protein n=1 Tax=Ramlibacter cellulosilyticus TaxID=2764187 RepID=A0A923SD92_9BURK|nr:S41 family peptidase [Ramlibacter cellulosilyticus]MBC5785786.1 hypothetical protein [Ramlibacter cellulosilyticus]